jgi:hypothetical protein
MKCFQKRGVSTIAVFPRSSWCKVIERRSGCVMDLFALILIRNLLTSWQLFRKLVTPACHLMSKGRCPFIVLSGGYCIVPLCYFLNALSISEYVYHRRYWSRRVEKGCLWFCFNRAIARSLNDGVDNDRLKLGLRHLFYFIVTLFAYVGPIQPPVSSSSSLLRGKVDLKYKSRPRVAIGFMTGSYEKLIIYV